MEILTAEELIQKIEELTLQGTNISPKKWHFEDDFPFPKVGYVSSLEGTLPAVNIMLKLEDEFPSRMS